VPETHSTATVFLLTLIPVLVAMDPLGNVPIFLTIAEGADAARRRKLIVHAIITAAVAGALFILAGRKVFDFLGITQYDFQIGGGLVLLTLALGEMFGAGMYKPGRGDAGIVPLGMPLVSGPAVLTTLVIVVDLHTKELGGLSSSMLCAGTAFAVGLAVTAFCFAFAGRLSELLGISVLRAVDRVVNLLLAAIAVMMIRSGVEGAIRVLSAHT
jgi:multiple antibiotic resistance protein